MTQLCAILSVLYTVQRTKSLLCFASLVLYFISIDSHKAAPSVSNFRAQEGAIYNVGAIVNLRILLILDSFYVIGGKLSIDTQRFSAELSITSTQTSLNMFFCCWKLSAILP